MPRATPAEVPCSEHGCTNTVDARRAALGRVGKQDFTLCAWHNEANLPSMRPARPEFGTVEGERANSSVMPAGPRVRRWV